MKPKDPPIDWLKAVILERMETFDFCREDVCTLANLSMPTFRTMMREPAAKWDYSKRKAVLKALHISVSDLPQDVQLSIVKELG